jgi:hypothetical protein
MASKNNVAIAKEDDAYEEFLEELSDDKDDVVLEVSDEFELGDENDKEDDAVEPVVAKSSDDADKTVWHTCQVWEHYRGRLMMDSARVAYLCSPNPVIIAHSEDRNNRDPENNLAVERIIERLILPRTPHKPEDRATVLAGLVEQFWHEREDFVKWCNYFSRTNIWTIAGREDTTSYEWHKHYSCPCMEMIGPVACLTASDAIGCGQTERSWKAGRP